MSLEAYRLGIIFRANGVEILSGWILAAASGRHQASLAPIRDVRATWRTVGSPVPVSDLRPAAVKGEGVEFSGVLRVSLSLDEPSERDHCSLHVKPWERDEMKVDVRVDSAWVKGPDRKSTSGSINMINGAMVEHRSRTQATSPNAVMMTDLGQSAQVRVWQNSNAARAIASRRGLGKARHVELKFLWLQELPKSGRVNMRRVPREQNLADHLTNGKSWREIDDLIRGVGARMKVSQGNKGKEHGRKKRQGEQGPHDTNLARSGTREGREGTTQPAG